MGTLYLFLWGALLAFATWRRAVWDFEGYKKKLNDEELRPSYIERLKNPKYEIVYRNGLQRGLAAIDWAFGSEKEFQFRGLILCIAVSFLYCLFGFIFSWAVGGPGKIGNTELLPEAWGVNERFIFTVLLVAICCAMYFSTANIFALISKLIRVARRVVSTKRRTEKLIALSITAGEAALLYLLTSDYVLTAIFVTIFALLGFWLANATLVGGLLFGAIAACVSGLAMNGTHRFPAAIAVLAAIALGGSHGTVPIAELYTRYFCRLTGKNKKAAQIITPLLVFGSIGAVGGAAFLVGASRTYSYIAGPQIDAALQQAFGFSTSSAVLSLVGTATGLVGGLFAAQFGRGAVFFGSFVCAVLIIGALAIGFGPSHPLYLFFVAPIVGVALLNMLVFFMALPIINAFWDWLSWEFSRLLGRRLANNISARRIAVHTLYTFGIGAILLVGLTASAVWAVAIFNKWMLENTKSTPLSIDELIKATVEHPFSVEGMWVTAMLFSTLIPTLLYLLIIIFAMLVVWTPTNLRMGLADGLSQPGAPVGIERSAWYFTLVPMFGFFFVALALWALYLLTRTLGVPISDGLTGVIHWCEEFVGVAKSL